MTTITISTPLKLKKTHFKSALEAGYFLIGLQVKQTQKDRKDTIVDNDPDRVVETPKNKKAYKESIQGLQKGFSLSQAKKLVLGATK